jgi:hypothetical protein
MNAALIFLAMIALVVSVYAFVCNQARGGSTCSCGHLDLSHLSGSGCVGCSCERSSVVL